MRCSDVVSQAVARNTQTVDFAPLPRRPTGPLTQTMARFSASVRQIESQREPHAAFWDKWNSEAINADGPLWVALGDSTSQGIGSPNPEDSWIPRLTKQLRETTGNPWRVLNLGITGAQFSDIAEIQLPILAEIEADGHDVELITHLAGANNLLAPNTWRRTLSDLRTILDTLPDHAVVARVGASSPFSGLMARRINHTIEHEAQHRPFHLFWPWSWPSKDGLGVDRWHPSAKGYGYMVDLISAQVERSLALR